MAFNGSGPITAAAVDEARKSDQLDSKITSENIVSANANKDQCWKAVRAHIAKGDQLKDKAEQHYIAAGQYLAALKAEHTGTWAEWEVLIKEKAGIGKSRASELMQIADGRKTAEDVRADSAERKARERSNLSVTSRRSTGEPEASAEVTLDASEREPFVDNPDEKELEKRRTQFLKEASAALAYGQAYDGPIDAHVINVARFVAKTWAKLARELKGRRDPRSPVP
jgi:hypothetical protein